MPHVAELFLMIPCYNVSDVCRASAPQHGRERPAADVRGVWPRSPDQRA